MLPSQELRGLAKRVDICLSGRTTPEGCDIRFRQFYWLMVFDRRGELLAANRLAQGLQAQVDLGNTLPDGLVALVEEGLEATPSLEALERRYLAERGSKESHSALQEKITAMDGVAQLRVAEFLVQAAAKTRDPGLSHARGILMEADACDNQVINHAAYARLRASIEGFLKRYPGHQASASLIEPLTNVALKYTFDLAAVCDEYAGAWEGSGVDETPAADSLRRLSKQLKQRCAAELKSAAEKLRGMKPRQYGRLRLHARLGQGQATLDGLQKSRSIGVMKPIHADWRKAATAKLGARK